MSAEPHLLERTPLYGLHIAEGGRMAPVAGFEMPLHYPQGAQAEHLHARAAAVLLDISHLGQIEIAPRSGELAPAMQALEQLIPGDILGLEPGRQLYGFFTNEDGGILDDLTLLRLADHLILIVNAANTSKDIAYLEARLDENILIRPLARALLALQGPQAEEVLARRAAEVRFLRFRDVRAVNLLGETCIVARSGATGEDGFEISVSRDHAEKLARALLEDPAVALAGLEAQETLRFEAGLPRYGAEIDAATTPVEAGLAWAIPAVRRPEGARAGGFPGAARIFAEIADGPPRRRVGLRAEGSVQILAGVPLFASETAEIPLGSVTSAGRVPGISVPLGMGYLPVPLADADTRVFADQGGNRVPLEVVPLPFLPSGFKRD